MQKLVTFLILIITTPLAFAEELKFVSVDFPPYSFQTPSGGKGAMYEVVQEIAKRLGQSAEIDFIPWARARFKVENNKGIAIIPLARTPDREEKYTWVIHILDDPYVLVTLKNSKVDITTLTTSKNLKIGVLTGSVGDTLLKKLGFTNLEQASTDIQNVKKLKLGRIDAWATAYSCRGQYKKEADLDLNEVRTGAELTIVHEYLGASKSLDQTVVKKWQNEFNKMKKDGSYLAIMKKYNQKPLP